MCSKGHLEAGRLKLLACFCTQCEACLTQSMPLKWSLDHEISIFVGVGGLDRPGCRCWRIRNVERKEGMGGKRGRHAPKELISSTAPFVNIVIFFFL